MARHDLYRNGNDKERKEERLSNIGTVQGTNGTICGGAAQKARKGTTHLFVTPEVGIF